MKIPMSAISGTVEMLLRTEAKRATKYLDANTVVSAQRKTWGNKIDKRARSTEITLKLGAPNYAEREFIKMCKKAGEKFPVKKIQLKFFPKKAAKK